ncbi:MAG: winged helix-turn-helix transcriptional regulator [Thermoproteota archaeon]|nr:winged helix-turn-helix transcriptional regulator [Thermoproteota archaeon]
MTTKSVKSRVDKMISAKVIERFIVLVDPSILGYKTTCTFTLKRNVVNKDLIDRISLVGDVQYKFHVLGGAMGFSIVVREGSEDKIELLLKSLQPAILGVAIQNPIYSTKTISYNLTMTDYHIIKQLVQNPRMEIAEIGKAISISVKTVRRRLDKMQNNHILEFTILPNPHAMKGQITYFLEVKVESSRLYRAVVEKIFSELHNHIILSSILHDQVERIGLILASEDVFKIESIRTQIESFNGVKEANVFLPTKIEYNQDSIVKSIEGTFTKIEKPYKNTITK